MLNKVHLIGYLGSDPDIRYTQDHEVVVRLRIATSETWKKNGEKHEKTEWHSIVLFGKLGEIAGEYLKKGSLVYIEGRLQTRTWDKDGETRYTTEVVAESMKMLPSGSVKAKAESDTGKGQGKSQQHCDDVPF